MAVNSNKNILIKIVATFLIALPLFVFALSAYGATYYVAANGNDSSTGTTESAPWQTLNKVSVDSGSGDTVLFRRGDVFRWQIIVPAGNMAFGAYGTGARPVISGAVPITGWTVYKDSVYVADAPGDIEHLFVNGELMAIARYPNKGADEDGFLRVDSSTDLTGLPTLHLRSPRDSGTVSIYEFAHSVGSTKSELWPLLPKAALLHSTHR